MKVAKERLHGFVASTARRWAFQTRVTLYNHTGEPAVVNLLVRDADGRQVKRVDGLARLPIERSMLFDVQRLAAEHRFRVPERDELVLHFELVPARLEAAMGPVEVEKGEIYRLVTAQDHYVEHYDPKTLFSSGVLYQTPPMNDALLAPKSNFIMQAPKVFLTPGRNTVFQVLGHSSDPDRTGAGRMLYRLRAGDGSVLLEGTLDVPTHGVRYLDVKRTLAAHGLEWSKVAGPHGFLYFEAVCADAAFIPITINIHEERRVFDMEHSLPPIYYGSKYGGPRKNDAIRSLVASFREAPVAAR